MNMKLNFGALIGLIMVLLAIWQLNINWWYAILLLGAIFMLGGFY